MIVLLVNFIATMVLPKAYKTPSICRSDCKQNSRNKYRYPHPDQYFRSFTSWYLESSYATSYSQRSPLHLVRQLRITSLLPGAKSLTRLESNRVAEVVVFCLHGVEIRHPAHGNSGGSALDAVAEHFYCAN